MEFDKYAKDYIETVNKSITITGEKIEYFAKLRIDLMKNLLSAQNKEPLKILDFGCGVGFTETLLKKSFLNAEIYGVDISGESIKIAKRLNLDNVTFLKLESLKTYFKDNYFDLVYCNGTFHHINYNEHFTVIKQMFQVLKSEGDIFIFENNPYNPLMVRAMKRSIPDKDKPIKPKHLKGIMINSGFKFNRTDYYVFYPKYFKFLRFTEKYLQWLPLGAQYFIWATKWG